MAVLLKNTDPWANMIHNGLILWRSCLLKENETMVANDVNLERALDLDTGKDKGSFIGRIAMCGAVGLWEPEIFSNRFTSNRFRRGIALFVYEILPAHWTHLVVTSVSRSFGYPGKPSVGGCVFAKPVIPLDMKDYLDFRLRMYEAQRANLHVDIDTAVEISKGIWPDGSNRGDCRLVVQQAWAQDAHFCYERISYEP